MLTASHNLKILLSMWCWPKHDWVRLVAWSSHRAPARGPPVQQIVIVEADVGRTCTHGDEREVAAIVGGDKENKIVVV